MAGKNTQTLPYQYGIAAAKRDMKSKTPSDYTAHTSTTGTGQGPETSETINRELADRAMGLRKGSPEDALNWSERRK